MPGEIALDTSVAVSYLRHSSPGSSLQIAFREVRELYLPLMALGELEYGAACSRNPRARQQLEAFLPEVRLLLPVEQTASSFAQLKMHLRSKGAPIPETDLWIAATAHSHGLALLCKDEHFNALGDIMEIIQVA